MKNYKKDRKSIQRNRVRIVVVGQEVLKSLYLKGFVKAGYFAPVLLQHFASKLLLRPLQLFTLVRGKGN